MVGFGFIYKNARQYSNLCMAKNDRMGDVSYLPLASGHCDINESAGVCYSLLRPALGSLLLLLWLNLFVGVSLALLILRTMTPIAENSYKDIGRSGAATSRTQGVSR